MKRKSKSKRSAFDQIKAGLEEAIEFAQGKTNGSKLHKIKVSQNEQQ